MRLMTVMCPHKTTRPPWSHKWHLDLWKWTMQNANYRDALLLFFVAEIWSVTLQRSGSDCGTARDEQWQSRSLRQMFEVLMQQNPLWSPSIIQVYPIHIPWDPHIPAINHCSNDLFGLLLLPANLFASKDIRVLCPDHCEAWLQGICSKVAQDTGLIQDANLMQITRGVAFVAVVA